MDNDYINIEKISDIMMYISSNLAMRMNVSLSSYDDSDNRKYFYNEYEYSKKEVIG